jgi:hypothetical protein
MTLIRKHKGKKRAAMIAGELYDQAVEFADDNGFTLASVIETAVEEFLEDRAIDERDKARDAVAKAGQPAAAVRK